MKKLFILAVVAIGFTTISCSKKYTCVCTPTNGGAAQEFNSGVKIKKSAAKTWCSSYASVYGSCSLK